MDSGNRIPEEFIIDSFHKRTHESIFVAGVAAESLLILPDPAYDPLSTMAAPWHRILTRDLFGELKPREMEGVTQ